LVELSLDWITAKILSVSVAKYTGATENARPENAGLENDGQHFSKRSAKLRGLENAGLENDGPC